MTTNPVLSYVHGIASMIEINKAATVSRTIMNAETCRAVLFSFDKGEALSEHTAAMPAVVMVLEGRLRIDATGRASNSRPGICCISAPGSPTLSRLWNPARCYC